MAFIRFFELDARQIKKLLKPKNFSTINELEIIHLLKDDNSPLYAYTKGLKKKVSFLENRLNYLVDDQLSGIAAVDRVFFFTDDEEFKDDWNELKEISIKLRKLLKDFYLAEKFRIQLETELEHLTPGKK